MLKLVAAQSHSQGLPKNTVSLSTILNSPLFALGFDDARKGLPFRDLRTHSFSYDRGRQFAVLWPKRTFKRGRYASREAREFYKAARQSGDIL